MTRGGASPALKVKINGTISSYTCGEIAFTAPASPGLGLSQAYPQDQRGQIDQILDQRNRARPAATTTNASSGTTLVQPAGNDVTRPLAITVVDPILTPVVPVSDDIEHLPAQGMEGMRDPDRHGQLSGMSCS